ncbi:MAG: VWA domain-containing protein [Spirochaetes bacterium]|nr:VWA domain-containing protein [Spirochaetota bacterium]
MKKVIATLLLAAALGTASSEATDAPVDLVVLLDVSQSMYPYFQDVVDFVVTKVASDYLRFGDNFHLLTFADDIRIEMVLQVKTEQDVKSILGRLFLLYPLGRTTDFVMALGNLRQYLADLPTASRKLAIVVTDGFHNPAESSPYASLDVERTKAEIVRSAAGIRENGWELKIIRIPFGADKPAGAATAPDSSAGPETGATPGSGSYLDDLAGALDVDVTEFDPADKQSAATEGLGIPAVRFPSPLGAREYAFSFPLEIDNVSTSTMRLELDRVLFGGKDILDRNVFFDLPPKRSKTLQVPVIVPDSTEPGAASLEIELGFADGIRVAPQSGVLELTLKRGVFSTILSVASRVWVFAILLIAALAAILLFALLVRGAPREAEAGVVGAVLDSHAAEQAAAIKAAPTEGMDSGHGQKAGSREKDEHAAETLASYRRLTSLRREQLSAPSAPGFAFQPRIRTSSSIRVELTVSGQTTLVGLRNIKTLHAGSVKSIGGARSDFLVFLVPMPHRIADIHFDGDDLILVPTRRELFPDYDAPIEHCMETDITFISRHGWPMALRFSRYVPPTEKLNSLLHCIETPGLYEE